MPVSILGAAAFVPVNGKVLSSAAAAGGGVPVPVVTGVLASNNYGTWLFAANVLQAVATFPSNAASTVASLLSVEWQKDESGDWETFGDYQPVLDATNGNVFYGFGNEYYYSFGPFNLRVRATTPAGVSEWSEPFSVPPTHIPAGELVGEGCSGDPEYRCCGSYADGNGGTYGICNDLDTYGNYPPQSDGGTYPYPITDPSSPDYLKTVLAWPEPYEWGGSPGSRRYEILLNGQTYGWSPGDSPPAFSLPAAQDVSWTGSLISAGGRLDWSFGPYTVVYPPLTPGPVSITATDIEMYPPDDMGSAITALTLQISTNNGASWTSVDKEPLADVWNHTALPAGTYLFRFRASNAIGDGPYSETRSFTATGANVPLTPSPVGISGTEIEMAAPDNMGSAITALTLQISTNNGASWTNVDKEPLADAWNHTALPAGTYLFRYRASNAVGDGPYSETRSWTVTPPPTSLSGTAGNGQVSLTWTAPASIGGETINDYAVEYSSNSGSTWTTFSDAESAATSATVTGLANGTAYVFRVKAWTSAGGGAFTAASSSVTPVAVAPSLWKSEALRPSYHWST
jgi:hypothetical protein